jgi:hypothetical protein
MNVAVPPDAVHNNVALKPPLLAFSNRRMPASGTIFPARSRIRLRVPPIGASSPNPLQAFDDFRARRPAAAEIIVRNLAQLLAQRLLQANTKIDLLSAN